MPLSPSLEARWLKLSGEVKEISLMTFPRKNWKFVEEGNISLHIFCDASKKAYACTAYLVCTNPKTLQSTSALISSTVRTVPLKELSIPRLELIAVLIGKRTLSFLKSQLDANLLKTVLWTEMRLYFNG